MATLIRSPVFGSSQTLATWRNKSSVKSAALESIRVRFANAWPTSHFEKEWGLIFPVGCGDSVPLSSLKMRRRYFAKVDSILDPQTCSGTKLVESGSWGNSFNWSWKVGFFSETEPIESLSMSTVIMFSTHSTSVGKLPYCTSVVRKTRSISNNPFQPFAKTFLLLARSLPIRERLIFSSISPVTCIWTFIMLKKLFLTLFSNWVSRREQIWIKLDSFWLKKSAILFLRNSNCLPVLGTKI